MNERSVVEWFEVGAVSEDELKAFSLDKFEVLLIFEVALSIFPPILLPPPPIVDDTDLLKRITLNTSTLLVSWFTLIDSVALSRSPALNISSSASSRPTGVTLDGFPKPGGSNGLCITDDMLPILPTLAVVVARLSEDARGASPDLLWLVAIEGILIP